MNFLVSAIHTARLATYRTNIPRVCAIVRISSICSTTFYLLRCDSELKFEARIFPPKQNYKVSNDNARDSPSEERPVKSTRQRRPEGGIPEEIRRTPRFPRDPSKKIRGEISMKKPRQAVHAEVARSRMKTAEEAARAAVQAVAEAEATAAAAAEQAARETEAAEAEAAEAAAEAAALAIRPPKKSVRAMAMVRAEEVSVKG